MRLRSILFVPGDREDRFGKALGSGADAVVFDLEDAVALDRKARARELVGRQLEQPASPGGPARFVRVNAAPSGLLVEDLAALRDGTFDGVVLPKALPPEIAALPAWVTSVYPIVETAASLRAAYALASDPRTAALLLGAVDLRNELSMRPRADGLDLLFARSQMVLDSAAARKHPPVDSVFVGIADADGFRADALLGASLGMGGKMCIHPSQVLIANEVYTPSADAVAWARRIVAGYGAGNSHGAGVISIDGEMVDAPVAARARRILDVALDS